MCKVQMQVYMCGIVSGAIKNALRGVKNCQS